MIHQDTESLPCVAALRTGQTCGAPGRMRFNDTVALCSRHEGAVKDALHLERTIAQETITARVKAATERKASLTRQRGSVTLAGSSWRYAFLDYDETGARKRISKQGFATERAARTAMRAAMRALLVDAKATAEQRAPFDQERDERAIEAEMQRRLRERMRFVYYVRRPDGAIKIGTTWNMRSRLASFRNATPVEVLAVHCGGQRVETIMHRRFAADRLDGEWFSPSPALLAHIAHIAAVRPIVAGERGARTKSAA